MNKWMKKVFSIVLALLTIISIGIPSQTVKANENAVAHTGIIYFYSISDAWYYASKYPDETIVLDTDWKLDSYLEVSEGKSVSIEMNGHKIYRDISSAIEDGYIFKVEKNATLNLRGNLKSNTEFTYLGYNEAGNIENTNRTEMTVTSGGLVTGGNSSNSPGAIYMFESSKLNLTNVAVNGNGSYISSWGLSYGGAILSDGKNASITLNKAHVDHNYAGYGGGGIALYRANNTLTMTDSSVDYNIVTDEDKYSYGGGIYIIGDNSKIIMTNSSISHNLGSDNGGGICNWGDDFTLTMDNSHIDNNTVPNGGGGGIFTVTFNIQGTNNSTISYNTIKVDTVNADSRDYNGAGLYTNTNATETNRNVIKGITFYGNSISFENITTATVENGLGGAIYSWGNYTTIEDCTIQGNSAYSGGGIYNEGKGVIIKNSTIENNTTNNGASTGNGAGIFVLGDNDLYLEGKIIVKENKDNYTHINNIYLGTTTDKDGNVYSSHLRGSVDSGSNIGISTPYTNDYLLVKELNNYIASAYKLDNPDGLYLDYNSSSKELWQRVGTKTYAVTINGYEVGKYKAQDEVTIDIDSIMDNIVTDKTEDEDVSRTRVFKNITSTDVTDITKSGSIVQFTMPNSDTTMSATFVTRVKDFTLSVAKPTTGEAFPSTGTLTWNNGSNSKTVPIYWVKKDSQKQETGTVTFNTEYAVVASIGQDIENDLAFSYDITNTNILVKYGDNEATTSTIAQVDSTGTLNTKGANVLSVSKIESVQTKRYDARKGMSKEALISNLKAASSNATVTLSDGSWTTVSLDYDNVDYSALLDNDKVTKAGTISIPLNTNSFSEKNITNPDNLTCSMQIELYNAWTAGEPVFDQTSGAYIGRSLEVNVSLGENATTLYYKINNGELQTSTNNPTTISLSLGEGETSKTFTIVAYDGNPDISSLRDSDQVTRTYTLTDETATTADITDITGASISIEEGSTVDALKALIPTNAAVTVAEGESTKVISLAIDKTDLDSKISSIVSEQKIVYPESGNLTINLPVTLTDGITNPNDKTFALTINVTKEMEKVATPELTASGTISELELTATCATEGATIKYQIDQGTESTYSAPFTLSVKGGETESTYSVRVWAEKDGYITSESITNFYTVKKEATPEIITVTVTCKDTRDDTLTTLNTETYTYTKGASVQIIAPPALGEKFEKWIKKDGSTVSTSTIDLGTLNDDTEVTVIYNPIITELDLSMTVPETNKELNKTISSVKGKVLESYDQSSQPVYREVDLTKYFEADNMTWSPNHTIAEPLTNYVARVPLVRDGNSTSQKKYVLAENLTVKINGSESGAKVKETIEDNDIVAYVAFPTTGKLTVQKIQPLETLKVSYVDAYDMQTKQDADNTTTNVWDLPTKATLVIDEKTKYTVDTDITWSIPENGFDKTNTNAQSFTVTGTLTIPNYLDLGSLENKIELTVEVSAQEQLSAPTSSVPTGSYNSTQTVSLSSNRGDATLYYTLDGSDPTTSSTEYNGAFDVKDTTTIKVFAVRTGMKDSEIATYTITINHTPTPTPTATPETKKKSSGWDDGGPFTTDTCGNVYDRWGNKIYEAKACNVGGYNLVGTSTKD